MAGRCHVHVRFVSRCSRSGQLMERGGGEETEEEEEEEEKNVNKTAALLRWPGGDISQRALQDGDVTTAVAS
ncbi:hypothetical protein EYF80_051902 [Liparis tanakae]|uniref:Uncharacterized protein n=1 Tax=Liparis tanakae TaxID=230148 RepID=A0A4Z2F9M2_9TELE|nr:hypothetical protein EYF80_051902 [Liparis tanakae]